MKHRHTDEEKLEKQKQQKAKALGQKTVPDKKTKKTKKTKDPEKAIADLDNGLES